MNAYDGLSFFFPPMMHSGSSHGVEVEAMSFLSLLAVVCFLQHNVQKKYINTECLKKALLKEAVW